MTRSTKIIVGLLLIELSLTAYFFYIQPQCEPCLKGNPCPPCISEQQNIVFWTGVVIAIISIIYFFIIKLKRTKSDL